MSEHERMMTLQERIEAEEEAAPRQVHGLLCAWCDKPRKFFMEVQGIKFKTGRRGKWRKICEKCYEGRTHTFRLKFRQLST